jgi:hypothetical protein
VVAEVVGLEAGEEPPDNRYWVLVIVDASGRYARGASMVRHHSGATFRISGAEADVAIAMEHAQAWADTRSIHTLYIRREV